MYIAIFIDMQGFNECRKRTDSRISAAAEVEIRYLSEYRQAAVWLVRRIGLGVQFLHSGLPQNSWIKLMACEFGDSNSEFTHRAGNELRELSV